MIDGDFVFKILTVEDIIRVPPSYFTMDLAGAVERIVREKYERKVDVEYGVVLKVWNIRDITGGKIILGDGAAYYNVKYDILTFIPELHEIVDGEVSEVVDFGLFLNMGPFDGLVHLSQITNEFISYDRKGGSLIMRTSKRLIRKGDQIRARIVTVSLKSTIPETKIALTVKGEGLGKSEWVSEEIERKEKRSEKKEKGKKEEKKEAKKEEKKEAMKEEKKEVKKAEEEKKK